MEKYSSRIIGKIRRRISEFSLDLSGYKVLTEIGSGLYSVTPIIPLLAGADHVFAWTRDSRFGKANSNIEACLELVDKIGKNLNIEFFNGISNEDHLAKANMITNSGFIRPLNAEKLKHAKDDAVIPIMYEAWELRKTDIDIDYCRSRGIKVAGTWESNPKIKVFEHVGPLAIKMAFEAGYEVFNNNILVWSDDEFGEVISKFFKKIGAKNVYLTTDESKLNEHASSLDFIFLCDYSEQRLFGGDKFFDVCRSNNLTNIGLIHLFGDVNPTIIRKHFDSVYPNKQGKASVMSFTLAHLGLNPFIDLQVAGFKVGELLLKKEYQNSDLVQLVV